MFFYFLRQYNELLAHGAASYLGVLAQTKKRVATVGYAKTSRILDKLYAHLYKTRSPSLSASNQSDAR